MRMSADAEAKIQVENRSGAPKTNLTMLPWIVMDVACGLGAHAWE